MAHSTNIISSIMLPNGTTYEIHDAQAIHSIEELGLSAAMVFKGTVATFADLPTTGNKAGDVWHVTADDYEYVYTDAGEWEELGAPHDFVGTAEFAEHTHNVTVTGTNAASAVTGSVTVPTVSRTQKYLTAEAAAPSVSTTTASPITGFGAHTTASVPTALTTTTVKNPTVSSVSIPNVTGNEEVTASKVTTSDVSIPNVTGNTSVTASKISSNTAVSIPNVTGNTSVTATKMSSYGSLPTWSAEVNSGVLEFSFDAGSLPAGSDVAASKVTLGTALSASKVVASDVTATNTTLGTALSASKVTATDVAATKVTLGDDLSVSKVTTSNVTVATGAFKTSASAITALGTPTTTTALTGVTVAAPGITLTEADATSTGAVPVVSGVTIGSESKSFTGTAAAQKWTQATGVTGTPQ